MPELRQNSAACGSRRGRQGASIRFGARWSTVRQSADSTGSFEEPVSKFWTFRIVAMVRSPLRSPDLR